MGQIVASDIQLEQSEQNACIEVVARSNGTDHRDRVGFEVGLFALLEEVDTSCSFCQDEAVAIVADMILIVPVSAV